MSTTRLLNDNDNQQLVSEVHGIVLTAAQKIIFKKFIDSMIDDSDLLNLLINEKIWLSADAEITRNFWQHGAGMMSKYHGLTTIPLIPEARELLEEFFLQNPEALENSYLENTAAFHTPYSYASGESKSYRLLKRLPDFLQAWALENNEHAKLIANHPELYKHSKENIEKERSLTESRWYKFSAAYFLVAAIAFAAVAAVTITFLGGAVAFLALSLGSAYLAYRSIKEAKIAPVAELADSHDADNDAANDANVSEIKPEQEKTVAVSISLTNDSDKPVIIKIGPFFQNKPVITTQNRDDSELEEKRAFTL
jgi:hypothetical protein